MVGGISLIWAIEETTPMLKEAVAKYPFWKLDLSTAQFVRFRAADWDEFPRPEGAARHWPPSGGRLGWLRGSIYWVLLFQGRFFATKPLSQKHRSTFLPLQDANPTPSFGGFGVRRGR